MHSFFQQLGQTVLARWQAKNFSADAFPQISSQAMAERPPAEHVDVPALVRDFLLDDAQPFQTQSTFGQPELVVYDNPRFYIQLLFWMDGTTDIHQHMFSGAFHVLAGSSLHSCYEFLNAESITPHLRIGTLHQTHTQILTMGCTTEIVSGKGFIHSLFHLDTPSITVVIRTHTDPGTGPQFTYLPPHLAVDPLYFDGLTNRRKQLLDVLEGVGDPGYTEIMIEMLEKLDFERGFFILQNGLQHLHLLGTWDKVWKVFVKKHAALADYVSDTLEEILRRDSLVVLRSLVDQPEHRFVLALLLNIPKREDVLRMIAERFPKAPATSLARWVKAMREEYEDAEYIFGTEYGASLLGK